MGHEGLKSAFLAKNSCFYMESWNFSTWQLFLHRYNLWYLWQIWALIGAKKISQQCRVVEISCTRCDRAHSSKSRPRKRLRLDSCSNASSATLHSHFLHCNLASCTYFATILPFCPSVPILHQQENETVEEQLAISNWITVCNNIWRKSASAVW